MSLEKRSFTLSGHRTSVALEPEFWAALEGIGRHRDGSLLQLVLSVDATRAPGQKLASALRVFTLRHSRT